MRLAWLTVGGKNASLGEMIGGAFREFIALAACGAEIRVWIRKAPFPESLERDILQYFQDLEKQTSGKTSFAVRSSATAEAPPPEKKSAVA